MVPDSAMSTKTLIKRLLDLEFGRESQAAIREPKRAPDPVARAVDERRAELNALSQEELELRLEQAEAGLHQQRQEAEALRAEASRVFNQPAAVVDHSKYADWRYLTLDQATSLFLSRDPVIVTRECVLPFLLDSPFAKQYEHLRLKLTAFGLTDRDSPGNIISIARIANVEIPPEMASAFADQIQAREAHGSFRKRRKSPTRRSAATRVVLELWPGGKPADETWASMLAKVNQRLGTEIRLRTLERAAAEAWGGK